MDSKGKQSNIEHTFMKYPKQFEGVGNACRQEVSLQEISKVPLENRQLEFNVRSNIIKLLCHAQIPQEVFYLKQKKMDRYSDIFACKFLRNLDEHSRIKIPVLGEGYYINGNQVKSLVDGNIFTIFSQAPVAPFDNFWQAAYYKNVEQVIMLCMFVDPRRGKQSERYWPNQGKSQIFSHAKLEVTNIKEQAHNEEYIVRQFMMKGPEGQKKLKHIHWMGWQDLKKPVEHKMEHFEEIIKICLNLIQEKKMIWIHCSAGIGRTGTLGGIIEAIRLYEKNKKFSIFKIVENMRKYRYHAVQTEQQYKFLYSYLINRLKM